MAEQNTQGGPLARLTELINDLSDNQLDEIGTELKRQVEADIESRSQWLERVEQYIELTTQVMDEKTFPWPGASNIKYPLVATAAVQFHARAFPTLFGNRELVKGAIIGRDPTGTKAQRERRVSMYMNYQTLFEMDEWLDDQDRMLLILPIIGAVYKKTYFNPVFAKNVSEMIHPRDFIINYDAKTFKDARKTHRIWKTPNQIKEMQNRGLYKEFDEEDSYIQPPKVASQALDNTQGLNNSYSDDPEALQELFECHCLLDLDDDGYKEPYIVTIRESDGKVYRIIPCFYNEDVEADGDRIIAIKKKEYFTPYYFLPDPESKVHGLGFGTMVGPMNEAVNTMINQLTDAGTLSNLQGGFLSRGVRVKGGKLKFTPGEWKTVNSTGDDLKKGIYPMPVREPSNVLFQLLGLLINSGKDLSSVQDIMVGRNPGQNQPYKTSQMVIEQGLQVFNGIYKRIYRSLSKEFRMLYKLNSKHLDLRHYMKVLDEGGMGAAQAVQDVGVQRLANVLGKDFNTEDFDIVPTAEPDMLVEVQRLAKAESLLQKMAAKLPINPIVATRTILEAEKHDNIEELMNMPPPKPNPEVVLKEKELQIKQMEAQIKGIVGKSEALLNHVKAETAMAEAQGKDVERIHQQYIAEKQQLRDEFEAATKRLEVLAGADNDRKTREQADRNPSKPQ